jgi:hypothetical protein
VVYRKGRNLMINKFSSCQNGLTQQDDFPHRVAKVDDVVCPVPGLDRCNNGNQLSSHTVAIDDENPNLVYVAYADNTKNSDATISEDIVVRASLDGGLTWPRVGVANSDTDGRRFMPWVCTANGAAFVSWYDRRLASANNNDLTDFFLGSVRLGNLSTQLVSDFELNLSGNADPQCASGWTTVAPRSPDDSEECSSQPQLAGVCRISGVRCDFSDQNCPQPGEVCATGGGMPKYGDYNGIACAAGQVYSAWASATAPPGLPTASGISIYSSVFQTASLNVRIHVYPNSDPGKFVVSVDGAATVSGGPLAASGFRQAGIGVHSLSVSGLGNTNVADYLTTFGADCTSNGQITLDVNDRKTCTMSAIAKSGTAACLEDCADARDQCMQELDSNTPELCIALLRACKEICKDLPSQGTLRADLVVKPPGDPGRFNLQIDGINRAENIGNGGTTGQQNLDAGTHTVGVTAGSGTSLEDYTIAVGGHCTSNGSVIVPSGSTKTCVVTATGPPPDPIPPEDREQCLDECNDERDICMEDPQMKPQFCVAMLNHCKARCPPD